MAMNYEHLMSLSQENQEFEYTDRDVMIYALGVGFGRNATDKNELQYCYEQGLKVMPTFATVAAFAAGRVGESGMNFAMMVHGEQQLTVHKPLPKAMKLYADSRVTGAWDKGEGKGAIVVNETVIKDRKTGEKYITFANTAFARGDGGFGGPRDGQPEPHPIPERAPDFTFEAETRPDQALLYRLAGDRNPLHADPDLAKMVGYPVPILHGLCTYGTCARLFVQNLCDHDSDKIVEFNARFSKPVYPGDKITMSVWKDGNTYSFVAHVKERDVMVINNGKCVLKD